MDDNNKEYYHEMLRRDRGRLVIQDGHLIAVVTYLIGDDDEKYLHKRVPWQIIEDDPTGTTVYIDQLLVKDHAGYAQIHREFTDMLGRVKEQFPQVERAKWIRIGAMFRKHSIKEGAKSHVHCKSIK